MLVYSATKGVTADVREPAHAERAARAGNQGRRDLARVRGQRQTRDHRRAGDVASSGAAVRRGRLHARRVARVADDGRRARPRRNRSGNRERSTATTCAPTGGSSARSSAAPIRSIAASAHSGARRVADALGIDFWIGLPEALEPRVGHAGPARRPTSAPRSSPSVTSCSSLACSPIPVGTSTTTRCGTRAQLHAAELPSSNGIGNARGLARLYASCIGKLDGSRTLAPGNGCAGHSGTRLREGRGADDRELLRARLHAGRAFGAANPPDAFGHAGAGGSLAFADPDSGIAFGYVMNDLRFDPKGDPRSEELVRAVYRVLDSGA